jgi:DNA-directed RNA polymerase specialized sigma24 family protein
MDESQGGGRRKQAAEDLILRTIAAHADSLLRTARRHSICVDDAQDAYQRAIELFMGHASRLDAARAPGWLHVVVKREAQAIQRSRRKILMSSEIDLDGREAVALPTPEEQLLSFDMIGRSAEALKRLKPHELRAVWLRAQGHSYSDISAITGWSYTKVNRCLSEGRRSFLEHYEGIESGEECERWLPVLSAMADGEASPEQVLELRPHLRNCPGCRATLRALQDSHRPLAALLPVPFVVTEAGFGDQLAQLATRVYESVAGGLHERAVNSFTKAQAVVEASAAGKVAVVASAAAAVAGGGYVSVERLVEQPASRPVARAHATFSAAAVKQAAFTTPTARIQAAKSAPATQPPPAAQRPATGEFDVKRALSLSSSAPEFRAMRSSRSTRRAVFAARGSSAKPPAATPPATAAPEFGSGGAAPEFGP